MAPNPDLIKKAESLVAGYLLRELPYEQYDHNGFEVDPDDPIHIVELAMSNGLLGEEIVAHMVDLATEILEGGASHDDSGRG